MTNRRGTGVVETLIASVIGLALIGILWSVFSAGARRGNRLEERLQSVHAVALAVAQLEADVAQAEQMSSTGDTLSLSRVISRDPASRQHLKVERVDYALDRAGRLVRSVFIAAKSSGFVGRTRFTAFTCAIEGNALRVTLAEALRSVAVPLRPTTTVLLAPLAVRTASHWTPLAAD